MSLQVTEQQRKIIEILRTGCALKSNCQNTAFAASNCSQALG
jgi:hypothetical protein